MSHTVIRPIAATAAAAANDPSWLWYATRGAGVATMVVLTVSVALGVATLMRVEGERTPRFVAATLHRNVSLLAFVLLLAHIVTTVLDPFAQIGVKDAVIPFVGVYRPKWLGIGVVAFEILLAVTLTSLLRQRIGPRTWRAIHWMAYAAWPLAVVHGLGTGSDAQAPWLIGLTAACLAVVLITAAWRLTRGSLVTIPIRVAAAGAAAASLVVSVSWAVNGPFKPGWTVASGTPASMLGGASSSTATLARDVSHGFSDDLIGTMSKDAAGRPQFALRDVVDTALTVIVQPAAPGQTLPVVTVARGQKTLCSVPARPQTSLYAVCGTTRMTIDLYTSATGVTGRLTTSGPL